ncbi:MAG: UDP-N-acetylmuramate dehydrogenase [Chloroflexota bacterium]|nr:UDP-N-acetylmuramate dehydrogenase [Chloroflexota bacterium]
MNSWPSNLGVCRDRELAPHTYFGIGGPAQYLAIADEASRLTELLDFGSSRELPVTVLGNASNVLIGDDGVEGLVIINQARQLGLHEREKISAESGALMGQLAHFAAENGIGGFEFGLGIPGSVGGSVFGNAGCFGSDISKVLERALVWQNDGVSWQGRDEFEFGYRCSALQREPGLAVVIEVRLQGVARPESEIRSRMVQIQDQRRQSQPADRSAGSIFKNPAGDFAGRLIEKAGLKGARSGAAQVSDRHANFIVNRGQARAADVVALMDRIRRRVHEVSGIRLEPEIRRIGSGFGETA